MSDFQKELLRRRILEQETKLGPPRNHLLDEDEEDEHDNDIVPPLNAPIENIKAPGFTSSRRATPAIAPVPWSNYFAQNVKFEKKRDNGDSILFNIYYSPPSDSEAPLFIFHHGAGSSGLSFAILTSKLREKMKYNAENSAPSAKGDQKVAGVLAFDMRGHGQTVVKGPDAANYSLASLSQDLLDVYQWAFVKFHWSSNQQIVLVGHSLGGAVVTNASLTKQIKHLLGVVVIDAVEELAINALKSMHIVLDRFPKSFQNIDSAIKWHLKNMSIRNKDSAAVSVPGIMKPLRSNENNNSNNDQQQPVTWITDLRSTEPYWGDWFTGLSANFLKAPAARLLILAGNDKLDKPLIIGQMQGKYQLVVFADSGHFVQEDVPDKTAITLIDFWERNGRPVNIVPVYGSFRTPDY